mgnify:FL=1
MSPSGDLASSAAFAGIVAVGVTVAIERFGGRLGGLIGTLPSTIVPASLGIYAGTASATAAAASANGHHAAFAAAMGAVPVGMLLNALFLLLWRELPPRLPAWSLRARLALMVAVSMSLWAIAAIGVVLTLAQLQAHGLTVGLAATAVMFVLGVGACLTSPPAPRGRNPVNFGTLIARGLLAAIAIGISVAIAQAGAEVAAGVASVLPAIFLTAMVSLWLSQGEAVPAGAVGPMMLGSTAVAGYALLAAVLLPVLGPTLGALASWCIAALGLTLPAWWWLRARAP